MRDRDGATNNDFGKMLQSLLENDMTSFKSTCKQLRTLSDASSFFSFLILFKNVVKVKIISFSVSYAVLVSCLHL